MKKIYREIRFGEAESNPLRKLRAWILLSSFKGRESDIYMAIHHLKDNEFFFANYAKEFFFKTDKLLKENKLRSIKRILIYENQQEIDDLRTQKIISFHSDNEGYYYKLLSEEVFLDALSQFDVPRTIDFGIFGDQRVYRARRDQRDFVIGTWSANKNEVRKYKSIFDKCWGVESALNNKKPLIEALSIHALFENS